VENFFLHKKFIGIQLPNWNDEADPEYIVSSC
jgi:hypothetical protein